MPVAAVDVRAVRGDPRAADVGVLAMGLSLGVAAGAQLVTSGLAEGAPMRAPTDLEPVAA